MRDKEKVRILVTFPEDYNGEFVVIFGSSRCPEFVPAEMMHHAAKPTEADALRARETSPLSMVNGLIILVNPADDDLDMGMVLKIQKEYFRRYYKRVLFPNFSPCTEDPYGVRKGNVPEIVREISRLQNIPYLLRYPLAEKLFLQKIGAPVLLLLPGPSLKDVAPRLKELSRHCLVVAISRTLQFCLENGVEPDFVIQIDTFLIQKHLYENIPKLKNTVLITISCTHLRCYAHKFRGVFFIGSFNGQFLQNNWRMRENFVSSLMACMGFAECLHSKTALLCGTDLSFPSTCTGRYFNTNVNTPDTPDRENIPPQYIKHAENVFSLSDRKGVRVHTLFRYIATAAEAEQFAHSIHETTGTTFHLLGDSGILSKELFPTLGINDFLSQTAPLDRAGLWAKIDAALQQKEQVRLAHFMEQCIHNAIALDHNRLFLDNCLLGGDSKDLEKNSIRIFADKERDYQLPDNPKIKLTFSSRIAHKWRNASLQAKNIVYAHILASRAKSIPLACLPHESKMVQESLAALFPDFNWDLLTIVNALEPKPDTSSGLVYSTHLTKIFSMKRVVFVSAAVEERYEYILDVYGGDNLVSIKSFLKDC